MQVVSNVVNDILNQVSAMERADDIKKLLYLKLEMELSQKRCQVEGRMTPGFTEHTVIDLETGVQSEVVPAPPAEVKE